MKISQFAKFKYMYNVFYYLFLELLLGYNISWIFFYIYRKDLLAIRILIQNGIMLYRTWLLVVASLNLASALVCDGNVSKPTAGTVGLAIIGGNIFLDFLLGISIWDKYLRYTFADLGVYIWALIGILVHNWDSSEHTAVITMLLLFLCIMFLSIKILETVWRHKNRPLYIMKDYSIGFVLHKQNFRTDQISQES